MQYLIHQQDRIGPISERLRSLKRQLPLVTASIVLLAVQASAGNGQQTNPLPNRPIVIPNRSLDPTELNALAQKNARKRNFDAANTARKHLIDDETNKLLILARDLKTRTDILGNDSPSSLMLREAAMIEFLANDVKEKMKLTVSPD